MARLSDILRKQELERAYFSEHEPLSQERLRSSASGLTCEELYKQLLALMRQVLVDVLNAKPVDFTLLKDKINLVSEFVSKDDGSLLRLIDRYDNLDDYLVVHGVNVCILSLEIGRGLNYGQGEMLDLGLGAFLHDIGMVRQGNILQKKRRLYAAEYDEIKNHVAHGEEILHNLGESNKRILAVIAEHHERRDGSGYLKGLKAGEIDEYAQIVGLADVYEALIHSRPHRNRFVPFEYDTVREIVSNKDLFEPYILRVFLERLTHHPSYMLWLATDGIYELLRQQHRIKLDSEIKPESRKQTKKRRIFPSIILILAIFLAGIIIFLKPNINIPSKEIFYPLGNSIGLAQNSQPLKIAYNFAENIADAPSSSLSLLGMDLGGYHFLAFSARIDEKEIKKMKYGALKISVENTRRETAHYYLEGVNNRWREFRIPLSYFDTIKDWSSVTSLSFALQPWNIDSRQGMLYIDDIRFFRKR